MNAIADLGRMVVELLRYGFATRRVLFPLVVTVAVVKVLLPVVIYPLL